MDARVRGWSLLKVEAIELLDDDWPGWVRVRLVDAADVSWTFEGKVPIFFAGDAPTRATSLPVAAHIRCHVLRTDRGADGREVSVVSTAMDGVETEDGLDEFRVFSDQIEQPAME
ncbi:hypothetical protein F4553_000978 [Allocatelliglobosispora scoriae]|uniref:Uncharacterized protein n=1 Tax=Allocatelliglobosispora scoriae TaxID=643052 RepID=A0A841BK89_9ACTN|nr:hypothetical protein [Allocatelliglobosispora scoriae]MBB5867599.1 hypothetical protein [Allocatelliglobosispora scoriae]